MGSITNNLQSVKSGSMTGSRIFDFGRKTYLMAILNCTPDSFYPASRQINFNSALDIARDMIKTGVDIIDIGGESSRPGAEPVSEAEELARVIPLIEAIRRESDVLVSIDTTKSPVAIAALQAGANIINDISGLRGDEHMGDVVAAAGVPVVIMHMRGTPQTMQQAPFFQDTIAEIKNELAELLTKAQAKGIKREQVIIDPGIGFGKRPEDNLRILKHLESFKSFQLPVLVGLSRKGFLGVILDKPAEERLIGTITANTLAVSKGANIIRVHDYREALDMLKVINAIEHC